MLGVPSAGRQERWTKLNRLFSKHCKESTNSASFSSMKNDVEIKNMLDALTVTYDLEEGNLPEIIFETLFNVISNCNRALYPKTHAESQLTHIILAIVCSEVEATISSEERVNGKQVHSNGTFEFLIRHADVMCAVAECKKGSIEEGVLQGLIGSEVICDLECVDRSLCIVTNYRRWIFYNNCQDHIYRFDYNLEMEEKLVMMPKKESLRQLAGFLFSFLSMPK